MTRAPLNLIRSPWALLLLGLTGAAGCTAPVGEADALDHGDIGGAKGDGSFDSRGMTIAPGETSDVEVTFDEVYPSVEFDLRISPGREAAWQPLYERLDDKLERDPELSVVGMNVAEVMIRRLPDGPDYDGGELTLMVWRDGTVPVLRGEFRTLSPEDPDQTLRIEITNVSDLTLTFDIAAEWD